MWILTILLCVISLHLGGATVDVAAREKQPDMPCKAAVSLLMKRQLAGITKCSKTMKFKNGKDKAAKMSCILKCVMIGEGILVAPGEIDLDVLDEFALKNIPGNLWDRAYPLMKECFGLDGVKVDPNEEFCKSYDPIIKCILENIPKNADSGAKMLGILQPIKDTLPLK